MPLTRKKQTLFLVPAILSILLLSLFGFRGKEAKGTAEFPDCLGCHKGIEPISSNHTNDCASCHLLPADRGPGASIGHDRVIRNPSDPQYVETFCASCHEDEIRDLNRSLHGTMAGIINQTRYLWGAQDKASPPVYGLGKALPALPQVGDEKYPDSPELLVDDFLRRRCLRCHIHSPGTEGAGLYRASGCAACHVVYDNDGRYRGGDKAVEPSGPGFPREHRFTRDIPNEQCLHCHNHNYVGADYEGLFEHDFSNSYRSPRIEGRPSTLTYGIDQHRLAPDVHKKSGLWCIDCHQKEDVMGDGRLYGYALEVPMRQCSDCHGGPENPGPDPSIEAVGEGEQGEYLFRSRQGRDHLLPIFEKTAGGHGDRHKKVRCSACHAQWSYQDYGLSVVREDRIDPHYRWYMLNVQADPYIEELLKEEVEDPQNRAVFSKDRISGEERLGIWSKGWRFRRWEYLPLGVDQKGRYTIMRPRHQYLISYTDRLGNTALDSIVPQRGDGTGRGWAYMPYVPHTTAPAGRGCDDCHENPVSAGQGLFREKSIDTGLTEPSPPAVEGMRLLNEEERKRLLEPSREYRRERLRRAFPSLETGGG